MNEDTIVLTMELPGPRKWAWLPDANMIILAAGMCPAEQESALSEVQAHWRRSHLRLAGTSRETTSTQPLSILTG